MQKICQDSCGFKQKYVFRFYGIKPFINQFHYLFNSPSHLHYVLNMNVVVGINNIMVNIKAYFMEFKLEQDGNIMVELGTQSLGK